MARRLITLSATLLTLYCSNGPEVAVHPVCTPTKRAEVTSVIAKAAGSDPVWLVDSAEGAWRGPNTRVKTAWIVSRASKGDLRIEGHRLDGPGRLLLAKHRDDPLSVSLTIPNAQLPAMLPGEAPGEVLARFSFHSTALVYPSPGCWEVRAEFAATETSVVISVQ